MIRPRKLGGGAPPPFRTSPQEQIAPAEPALEAERPPVAVFLVATWLRQAPSLVRPTHEYACRVVRSPSPCPSPPVSPGGGEGIDMAPSPFPSLGEGEGRGEGGRVFTHDPA